MSKRDGPAFARGLTVRQWYKGMALAGLCANPALVGLAHSYALRAIAHAWSCTLEQFIRVACDRVDAMIAEDEQGGEGTDA